MAMVEITEINVTEEKISIIATNLESLLLADDLFEDVEEEKVQYEFDRSKKGNMTYLYKVCQGQKKTKSAKSMGEKLEMLCGAIITLNDAFRIKE